MPKTGPWLGWRMQVKTVLPMCLRPWDEADGGDGLAFAERRRRDRGDVDVLALGGVFEALEQGEA